MPAVEDVIDPHQGRQPEMPEQPDGSRRVGKTEAETRLLVGIGEPAGHGPVKLGAFRDVEISGEDYGTGRFGHFLVQQGDDLPVSPLPSPHPQRVHVEHRYRPLRRVNDHFLRLPHLAQSLEGLHGIAADHGLQKLRHVLDLEAGFRIEPGQGGAQGIESSRDESPAAAGCLGTPGG